MSQMIRLLKQQPLPTLQERYEVVMEFPPSWTTGEIFSYVQAAKMPGQLTFHCDSGGHIRKVEYRTFTPPEK